MTEELHKYAREYADLRRSSGADFDKKHLRWNDIVAVGEFYGAIGCKPKEGVREAVDACVKGDPQYIAGRGPLTMIQPWMVPA